MKILLLAGLLALPVFSAVADDDYYRRGDAEWRTRERRRYDWYDDHQWRRRSPTRRQYSQFEHLLDEGARRGDLSRSEVRELRDKESDFRRKEARYWSDGRLSDRERDDLRDDLNDLNDDLRHELNDGEKRRQERWWPFHF